MEQSVFDLASLLSHLELILKAIKSKQITNSEVNNALQGLVSLYRLKLNNRMGYFKEHNIGEDMY